MGIIQGTVTDSSLRTGRTAFVRCLTRKELTVKPRFLQTRRIWVVSVSSKMCQATAGGDCVLVLVMTGPSSAPHFTRRSGLRRFGRDAPQRKPRRGGRMFDLRQAGQVGPPSAQEFGQPADPVKVGVAQEHPLRLGALRRHSPQAYANEFRSEEHTSELQSRFGI